MIQGSWPSRRLVVCAGLSALSSPAFAAPTHGGVGAMAALKAKLEAGQNAVLLVLGDSTAYSEFGPYAQFGAKLGAEADCAVKLCRWAEWQGWRATGPKAYAAPSILRVQGKHTLWIYLASLPGGVAGDMFDGSRREAALEAIPTPDALIWHHGHNHSSYEQPVPGEAGLGAGHFLGAVGLASMQWPDTPQAIVVQNPWRDSSGYDKIRAALLKAAAAVEGLSVIDGFSPFAERGRALQYYRDNIHPSDRQGVAQGAALTTDVLLRAYQAESASIAKTRSWPVMPGTNLLDNGDFSSWRNGAPLGWTAEGEIGLARDARSVLGGATHSVAMTPDVIQTSALTKILNGPEMARISGKRISLAVLVKAHPSQPPPFGLFVTPVKGRGATFTFGGGLAGVKSGWSWLVAPDIPIDAAAAVGSSYIKIYPAWGAKMPSSTSPVNVQKVVLVDGASPRGLMRA